MTKEEIFQRIVALEGIAGELATRISEFYDEASGEFSVAEENNKIKKANMFYDLMRKLVDMEEDVSRVVNTLCELSNEYGTPES